MPRDLWNTTLDADESARFLTDMLERRQPFTYVKFGDGDLQIMLELGERNSCDGEQWSPELSEGLRRAWDQLHALPSFYLGDWLSASSFGPNDKYLYADEYRRICHGKDIRWLHFEPVIVHRLTRDLRGFYEVLAADPRPKVFVGPERLRGAALMIGARHVAAPLATAHDHVDEIVAAVESEPWEVAILSAGRGAKLVEGRIATPDTTVIDAGSAFDALFVGRTRSEQVPMERARAYFDDLLPRYANGLVVGAVLPRDVSAVVVTRGDADLTPVLESLPLDDVIVWDNGRRPRDLKVFGRYAAIAEARNPVIYTQDDDCVVTGFEDLLAAYEPGVLASNMPHDHVAGGTDYGDSVLVGWGALFDRDLPRRAFARYGDRYATDDGVFYRTCDVVFSTLTPHRRYDFGFEHLPHAYADNKMWRKPGNYEERLEILARARDLRDGVGAMRARWRRRFRAARCRYRRLTERELRTRPPSRGTLRSYPGGVRPPAHVEVRGAHPGVAGPDGSPSYIPFDVDWLDDRGDILLHVNPRPDEGIVVLNSCMDGAWQEELVVDRYPFALEPDAEVTLRFDVLREHFQISTPDGQLCVFPHRRPPSAIVEVRSSAPLRVVERAG